MSKNYNFVTGEWEELPDNLPEDGPSKWWCQGWMAYMGGMPRDNPYDQGTLEALEWEDGYDAAEGD